MKKKRLNNIKVGHFFRGRGGVFLLNFPLCLIECVSALLFQVGTFSYLWRIPISRIGGGRRAGGSWAGSLIARSRVACGGDWTFPWMIGRAVGGHWTNWRRGTAKSV